MAKIAKPTDKDDLVVRARTDAEALGRLYDMYYEQIYRFCLCRLFSKEAAEDVTSAVFLAVARGMPGFTGRKQQDFANWLYRIAANHANFYIRKASRRKDLFAEATGSIMASRTDSASDPPEPDWPVLYAAVARLKLQHQSIIVLRFFENLGFEQIAQILKTRPSTVRVRLHRALKQLRNHMQAVMDGGK
ncbi:MAG TPA: sigma-70 family RNA polymerase sigma factor [Sedimentisphaerales bacterium]|nr:sigma-70 family RNA polymerase sigma factor [Sedimentisphaerales bacterium]